MVYSIDKMKRTSDGSMSETVAEFETLNDAQSSLRLLAFVLGVDVKDSLEGETDQWKLTYLSDATWRYQVDYNGWSYAVHELDPNDPFFEEA